MAHQALYRVYRPRTFSEVAGQRRTVATLREAVRQGRVAHAYLFAGPRGTGKTSIARILAKTLNCAAPTEAGDPCLTCTSCQAVEQGNHLDVIEIDAASNRGIDEIREIKERIYHQTAMSRYKVYIVDEVHMLTPEAFNALLKTLEEPPSHVVFILATTEPQKLPVTVLSRCQRYEFQRLSLEDIVDRLTRVVHEESVAFEPEALQMIADHADGALRDALSMLDQVIAMHGAVRLADSIEVLGALHPERLATLIGALGQSVDSVVRALAELVDAGADYTRILRDTARHLRDVMVYRLAGGAVFAPYRREWLERVDRELPAAIPEAAWIQAADVLAEAESRIKGGFPPDLATELGLFKAQQLLAGDATRGRERPRPEVLEPAFVPSFAAAPPSTPPPPATATVPTPERAKGSGRSQEVLELVRRERPSTYALLQSAQFVDLGNNQWAIQFEFPAHLNLMEQTTNRDVFTRAFKAVFGPAAGFRLEIRPSGDQATGPSPLVEEIRQWFGEDVRLVGFDEDAREDMNGGDPR